MNRKLLTTAFLSLLSYSLISQVPQGINYQAIALDGSGNPLVSITLPVRIGVSTDPGGVNLVWLEEHSGVTTNAQGLFSLVFGNPAAIKRGGTAASFSQIDWTATPLYLTTRLYYNSNWHEMGTSQLWSVPYSMVSGRSAEFDSFFTLNGDTVVLTRPFSLGSPMAGKAMLAVNGIDDTSEDPLFEVRRKDGKPVFSVYSEGVRVNVGSGGSKAVKGGFAIGSFNETKGLQDFFVVNPDCVRVYIDENQGKAVKGGFAIGSFNETKGITQDYLKVSSDSVRVYIDDTPGKAVKGGFAIGSFNESKSGGSSFFNIAPATTEIINPSEPRILWYPVKNAFLAGQVLIADPARVGTNSMSIGYETSAQGEYSQAMGYKSTAGGNYSTSIGKNSVAAGVNSFAVGDGAFAEKTSSYAFGGGARSTGVGSYAFGSVEIDTVNTTPTSNFTTASGDYSFAIGLGAHSSSTMGVSIGNRSQATGRGGTAIGSYAVAEGAYSVAMGDNALAKGAYSFAYRGSATGSYSVAIGGTRILTYASGEGSIAIGSGEVITGMPPRFIYTRASGKRSVSIGSGSVASGDFSVAMGRETEAQAFNSFVIGRNNIIAGTTTSWVATDPLFVVGNGTTFENRANAFTILKDGKTAIGHSAPTQMLDVDGQVRIRGGSPDAGKVLTSSGSDGTATWESIVIGAHTHGAGDITSGTLTVQRGGTGASTLAANKIVVGNGTSAVLSPANLHWDNTNSRLGIATATPGTRLQVNGNMAVGTFSSAPANGLAISGNVGIGTAAPADNLHLANSGGLVRVRMEGSSGNSSIEFRTGANYVGAFGANHTDGYLFIYQGDNISFRTGRVGIGNTNPGHKLDITAGNGRVESGYSWLTNSDIRYKKNVTTLAGSLEKVLNIRGVRYDNINEQVSLSGRGNHIGFIAQELEQLFPEFVVTGDDGYKSVAYDKMTVVLVEAVKEQQSLIESYKNEVSALQSEVEILKIEMAAIKQLVAGQQK